MKLLTTKKGQSHKTVYFLMEVGCDSPSPKVFYWIEFYFIGNF